MNDETKGYLEAAVQPYLEPLLVAILEEKPEQPLSYMLEFLERNGMKIKMEGKAKVCEIIEEQQSPELRGYKDDHDSLLIEAKEMEIRM